ncbi:MAG TPA: hypothetical protein ENJ44_03345, partial [Oceanospirillales bacterium]|nr:hypothetical protein [Oceanospirillales bacterium]
MNPDFSDQWDKLKSIANNHSSHSIRDIGGMFAEDENRCQNLSFEHKDIFVDFSKNWISAELFSQL